MMIRSAGWLVRRLGPRTLVWLALLLVALGSVAAGLVDSVRGLDAGLLLPVAALGMLLGWGLAGTPLPGWLSALIALALGVEFLVLRVGRLGGLLLELARALAGGSIRLGLALASVVWGPGLRGAALPDAGPILQASMELWVNISTLLVRVSDWVLKVMAGQTVIDPVAVALVWSVGLWSVAAWSAWFVRRRDQPLQGLAPAAALLVATLFYARGNSAFLLPLLGVLWLLAAWTGQSARQRGWDEAGVDYPLDVGQEVVLGGAAVTLLLVTAAMVVPSASWKDIAEWAQRVTGWHSGEARPVASSLQSGSGSSGAAALLNQDYIRAPGLPRRHLVGSGPELSERVVMVILPERQAGVEQGADSVPSQVGETEAGAPYYWRGLTYDRYIGRGWVTGPTEILEYQAGSLARFRQPFEPPGADGQDALVAPPGRRMLSQEVRAVGELGGVLYAAGDLVAADRAYSVAWRSTQDIFAASVILGLDLNRDRRASGAPAGARPVVYTAYSWVPAVGVAQLRASGTDYPDWVRDRYLRLPKELPGRVVSLARDLTATAPTPYDRALAIEAYLRTFPYNLEVPFPPREGDVVDFFLFDLREGYCDYFASSMVVLARAAGLPARLAVGYASGTYDATEQYYVVTEADAHAWAEIYFPGFGWVEFEPTSGRPQIERPADVPPTVPPELEPPPGTEGTRLNFGRIWLLAIPVGLTLMGAAIWQAVDAWRLRRLSPKAATVELYRRLYRFGRRLAVPIRPGDTPYEFAGALAVYVQDAVGRKRWGGVMAPAVRESGNLVHLYVQSCYGPDSPDAAGQAEAIRSWRRLQPRLWLVWAWRALGSVRGPTTLPSRPVRRAGRLPAG